MNNKSPNRIKNWFVLVLPALSYQFFQYRALPYLVLKLSGFLTSFALFLLALKQIFYYRYKDWSLPFWIKGILCFTLLSFFASLIFWGQPFQNTFRSSIAYFNLSFFFLLLQYKIKTETLIRLIFVYSVIVGVLWIYAIEQAPNIVFGRLGDDDFTQLVNNRGGYRIRILGSTISLICYFYCITTAYLKKKKWMYGAAVLLFIYNCTDLTRSNMASIILATLVLFYLLNRNALSFIVKTTILGCIVCAIIYHFFAENIDILISLTSTQFKKNTTEDDGMWRLYEYLFFFTRFNKSWLTILFGNGAANQSNLQLYINDLKLHDYYPDDVSYAIPFIEIGLFGLLCYICLMYKAIKTKVPKEFLFAKAYLVYVVISNITISTLMDSIPLSICLYLIYTNKISKKHSQIYNTNGNG